MIYRGGTFTLVMGRVPGSREATMGLGSGSGALDGDDAWRVVALDDLDDAGVDAAARAGFAWYRKVLRDGDRPPDQAVFSRLVALQGEYLHRFPTGDLSARATASVKQAPPAALAG